MAPYPSDKEITQLMSHLSTENFQPFFDRVAPDSSWDVPGGTSGSGHFDTLESWRKGALGKTAGMLSAPLRYKLINVTGGGDQAWAAVEMEALDAISKNGKPYPQKYCWVMRFNEQGIIVQVRVYADTQLSQRLLEGTL